MEAPRNSARPTPCYKCMQYHPDLKYTQNPHCYRCGNEHLSKTCSIQPNAKYCATCKNTGHRTAASNCPLRPLQGQKNQLLTKSTEPLNYQIPPPPANQNTGQPITDEQTSTATENEHRIKEILQENTNSIAKWVSTILTLTLPPETLQKAQSAINTTTDELLNARSNVLHSINGHIFVGCEPYFQKREAKL